MFECESVEELCWFSLKWREESSSSSLGYHPAGGIRELVVFAWFRTGWLRRAKPLAHVCSCGQDFV
jgi:hypothetical protein